MEILNVLEHILKKNSVEPIVIEFTSAGVQFKTESSKSKVGAGTESSAKTIYPHG